LSPMGTCNVLNQNVFTSLSHFRREAC